MAHMDLEFRAKDNEFGIFKGHLDIQHNGLASRTFTMSIKVLGIDKKFGDGHGLEVKDSGFLTQFPVLVIKLDHIMKNQLVGKVGIGRAGILFQPVYTGNIQAELFILKIQFNPFDQCLMERKVVAKSLRIDPSPINIVTDSG